jgi:hypothetical protein
VPSSADNVGVFEPATNAFALIEIAAKESGYKYGGGVLAPNGYIYFSPWLTPLYLCLSLLVRSLTFSPSLSFSLFLTHTDTHTHTHTH